MIEERGELRCVVGVGVDRRHVHVQRTWLAHRVARAARPRRGGTGDLGGAGLEPAMERQEPDRGLQLQLLDDLGMGEQLRERHRMTVSRTLVRSGAMAGGPC